MFTLRPMEKKDWPEVANLIYLSTNHWYESRLGRPAFGGGPEVCLLFCQVYEDLDPGCCLTAVHDETGMILGSCFYHPRETHMSLGIMNVHPNYFGAGVAGALLDRVIELSRGHGQTLRLVSSALNLDSYSLYNRKGFVPTTIYQDMLVTVPEQGIDTAGFDDASVRDATPGDVAAMAALELEVSGISREKDYRYFIENTRGHWHVSVHEDGQGQIDGYLASIETPGFAMVGPGVSCNAQAASALAVRELNQHKGGTLVLLAPADNRELVDKMYSIGARNCELHFSQVLGDAPPVNGIAMPTFMPETG